MHTRLLVILFAFCLPVVGGSAAWVLTAGDTELSPAGDTKRSADSTSGHGELIVHEWGTFTTFSGSDGVFLDFRPLASQYNDLPPYVLDRGRYCVSAAVSKSRIRGKVRMETPVTYFYTDRVRTVDVSVEFPEGLLTEFFPPVRSMQPPIDQANIFGKGELVGKSSLDWGAVDLIPVQTLLSGIRDDEVRERLLPDVISSLLPSGVNEQHYAQARATDSALVHVRGKAGLNAVEKEYFEKFLFYRGVGKFELPLQAIAGESSVSFRNQSSQAVTAAILVEVKGDKIRASKQTDIVAGSAIEFSQPIDLDEAGLAELVQQSLVEEGLYAKEASSMVETWRQSWFTENGTRVLYMVPAGMTEELLPLRVSPAPDQSCRVLVGRMELMTPESEREMVRAVAQSAVARKQHVAAQADQAKKRSYPVPQEIRKYGRLAEPVLARVGKISDNDAVRREALALVEQVRR